MECLNTNQHLWKQSNRFVDDDIKFELKMLKFLKKLTQSPERDEAIKLTHELLGKLYVHKKLVATGRKHYGEL